jgi:nitrite reductase/ring-hydroxylating ferredoxin subunit
MHNSFSKLRFFFIISAGLIMFGSCTKEQLDVVPETYVNITLINIPAQIGISQSMIITNTMVPVNSLGYNNNGIIIYRNSQDEYFAYDRTCPYHVEESNPVNIWTNPLFAVCPVCGTKYQLFWSGIPTDEGPSIYPLKQYRASYNPNTFELNISNY